MPGGRVFSVTPVVPLDRDGRVLLEGKTHVALPEPEFVIGADVGAAREDGAVSVGIGGDVDVDVEELNLIFTF